MTEKIRLEAKIKGKGHTIPFHKDGLTIYLEPSELISQLREQGYVLCKMKECISQEAPQPAEKPKIEELKDITFHNYNKDRWEYHIQKCYDKINELVRAVNGLYEREK